MNNHFLRIFFVALFVFYALSTVNTSIANANETKYYMGSAVNTGTDTGFSKADPIKEGDPHFGWTLGKFYVSQYTRVVNMDTDTPIFLKNVGDKVTLWFSLEQDIDKLNASDKLTISFDKNGYDEYFGIEKTEFGRGTLVIKYTDYQNANAKPTIYTDYLSAIGNANADTKVELCEEGDYEVALNYEIKKSPVNIFGVSILPSYTNYRIYFKFSVRNGNCMVFPFDTATKTELTNTSITENGFYLDLAKSRYLDIDIKKEILVEGADGLTEDTRFNRPAKDGESYTDEGIYTIKVGNRYTGQTTQKKIYVGNNNLLKAYVVTGMSISQLKAEVAFGAVINNDGTITYPVADTSPRPFVSPAPTLTPESTTIPTQPPVAIKTDNENSTPIVWVCVSVILGIALVCCLLYIARLKELARKIEKKEGDDICEK